MRICIREAHRDPRAFPDPLRVDADRFRAGGPPPEQYTPLGAFNHACLGEYLARAVGGALIRALAAYQVERVADGSPSASGEATDLVLDALGVQLIYLLPTIHPYPRWQ